MIARPVALSHSRRVKDAADYDIDLEGLPQR